MILIAYGIYIKSLFIIRIILIKYSGLISYFENKPQEYSSYFLFLKYYKKST